MGEDKSGKLKENETRPVLGNITNQLGKRGYSLISTSSASKSKSGNTHAAEDSDSDSSFWRQVSLVVEKLEKERSSSAKCPKIVNDAGLSPLKGGKTYRLLNTSGNARKALLNAVHEHDSKEVSSSALDSIDLDADVNVCDTLKESCDLSVKVGESSKCLEKECVEGRTECQGEETRGISDSGNEVEVLGTRVVSDSGRNLGIESVTASKSESAVSPRLSRFPEIKGFGLERCATLKGDCGCSLASGVDLLKECSCSFCTKAAYLWADLHYQDVTGRISALGSSQKEASNLAQKCNVGSETGKHGQENVQELECDLENKWRSLFLQMEDTFVKEGSQLKNQLLALKDLRDEFKMNSEMITGMPPDVRQYTSDASDHTR